MAALIFDLGLMTRKNKSVTIKQALQQTLFWVILATTFCLFLFIEKGSKPALEYISAYLMEWSLSVDNIFIFILILTAFKVKPVNQSRVLLIGVLMAIIFRILFITVGVALVERFNWVLYLFGTFLLYTGYKMFNATKENEFDPKENKVYKFLKNFLPVTDHDGNGKLIIKENNKRVYTTLFVVVILLASIDLVFALDSIPAVLGISKDKLVIYTSNIFAVLGLRSLFFLLKNAVDQFEYLPKGIALVLVFIGIKMLAAFWINQWLTEELQTFLSLTVIVVCISFSILYSAVKKKKSNI